MSTYLQGMSLHEKEHLVTQQKHDRRIRNQKCETCGAKPGWMCFTRNGNLVPRYHVARTQAAMRKEREEQARPKSDRPKLEL